MKKRYVYSLLFGTPGFIVSLTASFIFAGFAAGVLWLFVFGDNPWPATSQSILVALFAFVLLAVWLAFLITGFLVGKRLEQNPVLNKKHVLSSIAVTVLSILFIAFYQLSVGNLGPKSDGTVAWTFASRRDIPPVARLRVTRAREPVAVSMNQVMNSSRFP